jgi:hypothetical protein
VSEEVEKLYSNQEEANTKIVLHTLHASKHSAHDASHSAITSHRRLCLAVAFSTENTSGVF